MQNKRKNNIYGVDVKNTSTGFSMFARLGLLKITKIIINRYIYSNCEIKNSIV